MKTGLATLLLLVAAVGGGLSREGEPVAFEKQVLTERYFCDGIAAGDINRDGKPDIVAGPYWYEGPEFNQAHAFFEPVPLPPEKSPSSSMFSYVYDFSGDGWLDILVLGRVHLHQAFWYENPGETATGEWKKHFAFERVQGESPPFADVDGDGKPELVALWESRWGLIQPNWQSPMDPWTFHPVTGKGDWHYFYHGTGIGDVNGDGRMDLVLNDGWYEQPDKETGGAWIAHPFRFAAKGGAQILVDDVDGDGDSDIITALDAHGWGLAWFEQQQRSGSAFKQHTIMGTREEVEQYGAAFTQPHALALADIDGDGLSDIVTGKRRWAHGPTGDIEPDSDPVVYYFRLERREGGVGYVPQQIDDASGVGVQIAAADVTGDGRVDILTASKLGMFLFRQK